MSHTYSIAEKAAFRKGVEKGERNRAAPPPALKFVVVERASRTILGELEGVLLPRAGETIKIKRPNAHRSFCVCEVQHVYETDDNGATDLPELFLLVDAMR